jgi:tRNA-splicing endonuclease subunit Sen34
MADVVREPFPIFQTAPGRYMLYDLKVVAHVRAQHQICGVLIGSIPNAMQQNIFNGLPVELMPEEVRLLVTHGHAYVVDDLAAHLAGFAAFDEPTRLKFQALLAQKGLDAAKVAHERQSLRKAAWEASAKGKKQKQKQKTPVKQDDAPVDDLFVKDSSEAASSPKKPTKQLTPMLVTPTVSYPPLTSELNEFPGQVPEETVSFLLYEYLQSKAYFMSPGLRFGCQFMVYPGDPLRFHSHFLANGKAWDEPIDLIDIVGGGRLGTGVKKGFLIGGRVPTSDATSKPEVRTFCIEWAAM